MIILSFDDGTYTDLRLAELLLKYGLKAIFYIPSNCELSEEDIQWLDKKGMTIGGHTVNHYQDMKLLPYPELEFEIKENKKWLEEIIDKEVTSFCYPRGRFNEQVKEMVKEADYKEARTTKVLNLEIPKDKFEIATSVHITYPREEYRGRDQLWLAKWFVDGYFLKTIPYCHLWGHSKEAEKFQLFERLEDLFKYIKEKK